MWQRFVLDLPSRYHRRNTQTSGHLPVNPASPAQMCGRPLYFSGDVYLHELFCHPMWQLCNINCDKQEAHGCPSALRRLMKGALWRPTIECV